jgi:hypothetical protein
MLFNMFFGLRQAVIPLINAANNLASPVIDVFTAHYTTSSFGAAEPCAPDQGFEIDPAVV